MCRGAYLILQINEISQQCNKLCMQRNKEAQMLESNPFAQQRLPRFFILGSFFLFLLCICVLYVRACVHACVRIVLIVIQLKCNLWPLYSRYDINCEASFLLKS